MAKKIVYGMAKFCDQAYGYGSNDEKFRFDPNKLLRYLNKSKKVNNFEVSKRYKDSLKYISKLNKQRIHYKIDNIPKNNDLIEDYINKDIDDYFNKTGSKFIEILYLHQHEIEIISNPIVLKTLKKFVDKKKIKFIGVSIYNKNELDYALKSKIIKVIQLPVNIADSYLYSKIKNKNNKIIVARSIFLQGSLINDISDHPKKIDILEYKKKIQKICKSLKISYLSAVTSYVFNLNMIDYILISTISKKNMIQTFNSIINIDKKTLNLFYKYSKEFKSWTNPLTW